MVRNSILAALTAFVCLVPASAQTAKELSEVEAMLKEGSARFLSLVQDLDAAQWNAKVGDLPHTVGEEAEHIALSENELQNIILQAFQDGPKAGAADRTNGKVKVLQEAILGEEKAENFKAAGKIIKKSELLEFYPAAHAKLLRLFESSKNRDLKEHTYVHPVQKIGELNALQWFYYIAYHRERHIRQIETMLDHPDFPGNTGKAD